MSEYRIRLRPIGDRLGHAGVRTVVTLAIAVSACRTPWAQQPQPAASTILNHLNAVVSWYRRLATANETAGKPSDALYLANARALARESVQLAVQSAESEAALLPAPSAESKAGSSLEASSEQQNLAKTAAATEDRINQVQPAASF